MTISAHNEGRRRLIEALSGGPVVMRRQPEDGLYVITVCGQTFTDRDVEEALRQAAQFVRAEVLR